MKHVYFYGCKNLKSIALQGLLKSMPQVLSFYVYKPANTFNWSNLLSSAIRNGAFDHLECLHLSHVHLTEIFPFAANICLKHLKRVSIVKPVSLTLESTSKLLSICSNLEMLQLKDYMHQYGSDSLHLNGICNQLQALEMENCYVHRIYRDEPLPVMKRLVLRWLYGFDHDDFFQQEKLPVLDYLSLVLAQNSLSPIYKHSTIRHFECNLPTLQFSELALPNVEHLEIANTMALWNWNTIVNAFCKLHSLVLLNAAANVASSIFVSNSNLRSLYLSNPQELRTVNITNCTELQNIQIHAREMPQYQHVCINRSNMLHELVLTSDVGCNILELSNLSLLNARIFLQLHLLREIRLYSVQLSAKQLSELLNHSIYLESIILQAITDLNADRLRIASPSLARIQVQNVHVEALELKSKCLQVVALSNCPTLRNLLVCQNISLVPMKQFKNLHPQFACVQE